MRRWARAGLIALAAVALLAALFPAGIYLASEAMIVRHYTLPSSIIHAAATPKDLAWGKHVATLYGCRDCHSPKTGAAFTGRMMTIKPGLHVAASNLRLFAQENGDADFDRAVRRALSPSAQALWLMPSNSYVYMRDADLAAIIGYIRSLPLAGHGWPKPSFSFAARIAVLAGSLSPTDPYDMGRSTPRDVGPHWDGGRYLAAMACSSCHGSDLTGHGKIPDLDVTRHYGRQAFFALMREGTVPQGRHAPAMARLAARRFHVFKDYEIDALYAYLIERARTPAPPIPPPPR